MQLHHIILIYILGFLRAISADTFDDTAEYSLSLQRKLILKLKTATRLKHNFGKVLHELPIQNYELYHSVKTIEDYLKNGGSLIECLDVLPSIAYASIEQQIDGILGCMEDRLPKYLMPAVSLIRRYLSEGILDANEIYRPTWGLLKSDPLEKIPLKELKEAASSLRYRQPVKNLKGPWPKLVGEIASLINHKIISPHRELIAYMLANLRIYGATPEVRESIVHFIEYLQSQEKNELTDFRMSSDPYELVANVISSLFLENEILVAANTLLPFLKKPSKCRGSSEFANFFKNNTLNYTLLISRDRMISRSKAGITLLSMIQQNDEDVRNVIKQFLPFEYAFWKDLLLAFVSQLRRKQFHQGEVSDVVDSVYAELILKDTHKRWQLLRHPVIAATVLTAIAKRENSIRIRRLLLDVASSRIVEPEVWRKALAFDSSEDINGPMDAALKTLKVLEISGLLPRNVLQMNVAELLTTYDIRNYQGQVECNSKLVTYLTNFTKVKNEIDKKMKIRDVDVEDLLQALPNLDVYTDEYRNLKSFLSQDDLEAKIGQVDLNAYPIRGRLLVRLLQMMEHADGIDNSLRHLAKQFVDNVAYEGYGAGALLYRSS